MISDIIMWVLIPITVFAFFIGIIRNFWVYHTRIAWIHDEVIYKEWPRVLSYHYMVWHFWRWSKNFEDWSTPKPILLSDVRPSKSGQLERFKQGLK